MGDVARGPTHYLERGLYERLRSDPDLTGFFCKPYDPEDLVATVADALARSRA